MSNDNKLEMTEPQGAELPISHSVQTPQLTVGFVPPIPEGGTVDYAVAVRAFEGIPQLLEKWEDQIVQKTNELLLANETSATTDLDGLFAYHTEYVAFCMKARLTQRARALWRQRIAPLVNASEARLRTTKPHARIHRGAPLYNVGICSFVLGDFDRALQFIAEAGSHDEALGRGNPIKILIGDHGLSEQVFIRPLANLLKGFWTPDYSKITGAALDETELKQLLGTLADRPSDSIQVITALHRLCRTLSGPQNVGTSLVRFRALAELLHVIESFLRHFQTNVHGELGKHLNHLVAQNPIVKNSRSTFKKDRDTFAANKGHDPHACEVMNWISDQMPLRVQASATPANATGVAIFFCHQFRNSLLHVNEENLTIFQNKDECVRAVAWVLGVLRGCARAKEGKFSSAHFA